MEIRAVGANKVIFETGGPDLASAWFSRICGVHDDVFSREPFAWVPEMSPQHEKELSGLANNPGFKVVVVRRGDHLIGYIYGHPLAVNHGWWHDFLEPLPVEFVREWNGRTFAAISMGVRPEWRGRGLGRRLMDALLDGRQEQRAVLSVQPTALSTQEFYRHLGWRTVGRKGPLAGVTPPFWDIYVRELGIQGA
ncbi:N-acetyltransferase family protein [Streptomyces sp. NPDC002004]